MLALGLSGACADTTPPAATTAPPTSTSSSTTTTATEPLTVSGGPALLDRDGNPMLGGAGPWEVVRVLSGEALDVRQDEVVVPWRLAQVDAPEGEECHATESQQWLQDYVRPASHPYFVFRPSGEADGGDGRRYVEMVVADMARVVDDRGSVNVAAVRAGMARWTGPPPDDRVRDDRGRAFVDDLALRLAAAEAEAKASERGLWGACPPAA